jgi:hypothetical protein
VARVVVRRGVGCWIGALVAVGCGSHGDVAKPPAPAAQHGDSAQRASKPPSFTFVAPVAWRSRRAGAPPIEPPDLAQETWSVLVNQNAPIQAKTPHWQALPAGETVELEMPAASHFRCIAAPLQVSAQANVLGTELKAWRFERHVLCSSDGWRSWSEAVHRVRVPIGGERVVGEDAGLLLREQDAAGGVRQTYVLLRSGPQHHDATTGPPQVLDGVAVEEE